MSSRKCAMIAKTHPNPKPLRPLAWMTQESAQGFIKSEEKAPSSGSSGKHCPDWLDRCSDNSLAVAAGGCFAISGACEYLFTRLLHDHVFLSIQLCDLHSGAVSVPGTTCNVCSKNIQSKDRVSEHVLR